MEQDECPFSVVGRPTRSFERHHRLAEEPHSKDAAAEPRRTAVLLERLGMWRAPDAVGGHWVVLPTSKLNNMLEFSFILCTFVQGLLLPYSAAFGVSVGALVVTYLLDVILLFDAVLSTRLPYETQGTLELGKAKMWRRYLRQGFTLDLISSFPFEILALIPSGSPEWTPLHVRYTVASLRQNRLPC
jgi:hypothetical protein